MGIKYLLLFLSLYLIFEDFESSYEDHAVQPTFNSVTDLLDTHLKERVHQPWAYPCNQRAHKEMKDLSADKTVISPSKS